MHVLVVTACDDQYIPQQNTQNNNAAGWALLGILVALAVVDILLLKTKHLTISQWLRRRTKGKHWWRAFGMISIGLILWHLFFGGPI